MRELIAAQDMLGPAHFEMYVAMMSDSELTQLLESIELVGGVQGARRTYKSTRKADTITVTVPMRYFSQFDEIHHEVWLRVQAFQASLS